MGAPPLAIGRYVLHDVIASGGMASVHFGRLIGTGGFSKTVAIKRLHRKFTTEASFRSMILEEARLAARIRHPNVVPPLDVLSEAGELLLVMEYVHGESFSRLLKHATSEGGRVPVDISAAVLSNVLHGLHAAHEARDERGKALDIVHRDVSPQNIIVGVDGTARIIDFGIAKAVTSRHITASNIVKGKLPYVSPEQLDGEKATRRTDVYAATVVFWEALAGRRLFNGTDAQILKAITAMEIPPPSSLNPDVTPAIDAVVRQGMARDPAQRFASARDMALAVEHALHLATPTVVGGWVEELAAEALADRARNLAAVERGIRPDEETTTDPTLRTEALVELPVTPVGSPRARAAASTRPRALMSRTAPLGPPPMKATLPLGQLAPSSRPPEVAPSAHAPVAAQAPVAGHAGPVGSVSSLAVPSAPSRHLPTSSQAPPPVGSAPSLHPESFDREARQALLHPGESSRGRRVVRTLASAVAVLLGLTLLASPVLVRRWAIVTAAQHGIEMSIDHVELTRAGLRFVDVRASARDLPLTSMYATGFTLGFHAFVPSRLSVDNLDASVAGDLATFRRDFQVFAERHPVASLGPLRSLDELIVGSLHLDWQDPVGKGTSALVDNALVEVKRTEGRPLGADFKIAVPLVTVRANAGGTFGPWALTVERARLTTKRTLRFDPNASAAAIIWTSGDDGSVDVTFAVPATAPADLHLPDSVLGRLSGPSSRLGIHGSIGSVPAPGGAASLTGSVEVMVSGAVIGGLPAPVDMTVQVAVDAPATTPSELTGSASVAVPTNTKKEPTPMLQSRLAGTLDPATDKVRLTLRGRSASTPCVRVTGGPTEAVLETRLALSLENLPDLGLDAWLQPSCTLRAR